jgi:protein SCO1
MTCRLALAAPLALALVLAACGQGDTLAPEAPTGPLPDVSLYHLDAEWTTHDEATVKLADFRGRPVVVTLVYAHCAYACPRLVHDVKRVASDLGARGDVRYVLVSLDPERDTPEQLRSLKEGFGLDDRWTLLRGDPRDVRRLAALLGVQYRTEPDGEVSHSNLITVLDRDGVLARQQEGLGADPSDTVATLKDLLAAR